MTDKRVQDLTAASALDGTELIHVVQSGNSRQSDIDAVETRLHRNFTSGYKGSIRCATTSNINLATGGLLTCDGVTTVAGDRVLVIFQTAPAENGIYVAAAGAWSRAEDANSAAKLAAAFCAVEEGATWGGYILQTTFKATDTLGTSDVIFYQVFSKSGAVIQDSLFSIYSSDGTRILTFDLSTAFVGDTFLRLPSGGGTRTLVTTDDTQTLANKTLTAPVLGTPASGNAANLTNLQAAQLSGAIPGTVTGTTQSASDNSTKLATTAYADAQASLVTGKPFEMIVAVGDETTDLTVGTAKVTFRMPRAVTLSAVHISTNTAPTGAAIIVDVNEDGVSIFSANPQIAVSAKTNVGGTLGTISDANIAADAEVTIDIDQVGSTIAGKALKVALIGVYQ